jgi:hypothetical protein
LSIKAGKAGEMGKSREEGGESKIKALSRKARQVIVCTSFFEEIGKVWASQDISQSVVRDSRRIGGVSAGVA